MDVSVLIRLFRERELFLSVIDYRKELTRN
jgi:hypothetical protein